MMVGRHDVRLYQAYTETEFKLLKAVLILNPVKYISNSSEAYTSYYALMERHHDMKDRMEGIGVTFPAIPQSEKIIMLESIMTDTLEWEFDAENFMNSIVIASL